MLYLDYFLVLPKYSKTIIVRHELGNHVPKQLVKNTVFQDFKQIREPKSSRKD